MSPLDANGVNEHGVLMCECRRFGRVHAWEPGESCGTRVIPQPAADPEPPAPQHQGEEKR